MKNYLNIDDNDQKINIFSFGEISFSSSFYYQFLSTIF